MIERYDNETGKMILKYGNEPSSNADECDYNEKETSEEYYDRKNSLFEQLADCLRPKK